MSSAEGARVRPFDSPAVFDPAALDDAEVIPTRPRARRPTPRPGAGPATGPATGSAPGGRPSGATRWTEPAAQEHRLHQPRDGERSPRPDRRVDETSIRSGVRLNGLWCAVLLVVGVAAALGLAGALSWRPGVPMTIVLAAVGVGVALLAGRGGGFEAGILPGTVVIVVGAAVVAFDSGALGGAVAGLGPVSRVWQAIGLLAPAAAATWVCALVTLALRRAGVLRRF